MATKDQDSERQITFWGPPSERLESQWGTIPYREWCAREADRIARRRPAYARRNGRDRCAVCGGRPQAWERPKLIHVGTTTTTEGGAR